MERYKVSGMSCAACAAAVEKAVKGVDGVSSCSVSLLTNSMNVEGDADPKNIISAVEKAGYGASADGVKKSAAAIKDDETPKMIKRLALSVCLLLPLMYVSMGHTMWGWPLPSFFGGNHVAVALIEMILAAAIMVINQKFFVSGTKGLLRGAPNMDTLVAMGSAVSFLWSVYIVFKMTAATDADAMAYMMDLYFESAAMILTLITVGKTLEARAKGKTTDAINGLMRLSPETALVVIDGKETEIPVEKVKAGDIFAVRAGGHIPVDGVVIDGSCSVDESALTGESIPVDKTVGDAVSAATTSKSGYILCKATRVGSDTTLAQIIKTVSDAAASKAPIAKIADKVAGVFVPVVIAIAAVTTAVWLLIGQGLGYALARGISVLVISCPCALGLATPVAIMVGSGKGARNGILFKTAEAVEQTGKTAVVALDKTGTITLGEPSVTDVMPYGKFTEETLLTLAASLEAKSEHPLAKAVMKEAEKRNISPQSADGFAVLSGSGLTATLDGKKLVGGSVRFVGENIIIPEDMLRRAEGSADEGKTPLMFAFDGELCGMICVADTIKPDAEKAVKRLKDMGIYVVMLTGDNERTARYVGKKVGVDEVVSGVLPGGKADVIKSLKSRGSVAMVGDGINDAPALTVADTGIAIGAGTDIAIDAADVVLMKRDMLDVPAAVLIGRKTLKNVKENLFWAFVYNVIGIPLAAGALVSLGITLSPMIGAAAMSLSSVSVVANALRLNLLGVYDGKKYKKSIKREKKTMKKTYVMKIEGMMCPHCQMRVKNALEAVKGVESADVDHKKGTAVVAYDGAKEDLSAAVVGAGYKVVSVEEN